jgi:hypothetical protein
MATILNVGYTAANGNGVEFLKEYGQMGTSTSFIQGPPSVNPPASTGTTSASVVINTDMTIVPPSPGEYATYAGVKSRNRSRMYSFYWSGSDGTSRTLLINEEDLNSVEIQWG